MQGKKSIYHIVKFIAIFSLQFIVRNPASSAHPPSSPALLHESRHPTYEFQVKKETSGHAFSGFLAPARHWRLRSSICRGVRRYRMRRYRHRAGRHIARFADLSFFLAHLSAHGVPFQKCLRSCSRNSLHQTQPAHPLLRRGGWSFRKWRQSLQMLFRL